MAACGLCMMHRYCGQLTKHHIYYMLDININNMRIAFVSLMKIVEHQCRIVVGVFVASPICASQHPREVILQQKYAFSQYILTISVSAQSPAGQNLNRYCIVAHIFLVAWSGRSVVTIHVHIYASIYSEIGLRVFITSCFAFK